MKIGILQTGAVRPGLAEAHGEYPAMIGRLLGGADPGLRFDAHAIVDGAPVPAPDGADGWVITGSRHGVYDALPWIEPLKAMLREARAAGVPIVGICFGHQLLAEAFGGRAVKYDGGWQVGPTDFAVIAQAGWRDAADRLTLHSLHQDQVVSIPDDATVWATAPGCRYAALSYGDPERPEAVSIQPHPEFEPAFARDLVAHLDAAGRFPGHLGREARAAIGKRPVDNGRVGGWLARYLRLAARR
jgi:GMP synthase-like glutamine amidotransferase